MRGARLARLACLIAVIALARVAIADSSEAAKTHYSEGLKRYNLGEYAKALDGFKAAYLAKPDPVFLFNIAQCQRQLAQFEDAGRSYRAFLRENHDMPQGQREQVQRLIADMEAAAKEGAAHRALPPMEAHPPNGEKPTQPGRIQVTSDPSGAVVRLDSAEGPGIGETPYEARSVLSGKHTVYVTRSGYDPKSADVAVEPNGISSVHLTLTAASAREAPARKPRYWIAGIVVGAVAVAALGIGLGVGLSSSRDASVPSTELGSMTVNF